MVVRLNIHRKQWSNKLELTPGNCYRVISMGYDSFRLMADDGRASLYDSSMFDVVSNDRPPDWITKTDPSGKIGYSGPAAFSAPGFFEDYWDGKPEALKVVWTRLQSWSKGEDHIINDGESVVSGGDAVG